MISLKTTLNSIFRKERDFYEKYSVYEKQLSEVFKFLHLKEKAVLPSDKEYCEEKIVESFDKLRKAYFYKDILKMASRYETTLRT